MAAISAESFEGFLAGILVQQAFAFFRIELGGEELVASGTQMREPFFIFRAELFFELFSEALGKGRALPSGRNGDLQGPALHNGGIVEIAELGNIDYIAKHTAPARFFEYALLEFRGRCGRDNQKHSFKIVRMERALMPFDGVRLRPGAYLGGGFRRNHAHLTAGVQQAGDFRFGDGSRADDEAGPSRKLEEHGEELCRFHAFTRRAPQ